MSDGSNLYYFPRFVDVANDPIDVSFRTVEQMAERASGNFTFPRYRTPAQKPLEGIDGFFETVEPICAGRGVLCPDPLKKAIQVPPCATG